MAVGGGNEQRTSELITIGRTDMTCPEIADLPYDAIWLTGGFTDNKPVVCGGLEFGDCYSYSFEDAEWSKADSLMLTREGARSISLEDGSLWVTGGRSGTGLQSTTEVFSQGSLTQGRSLP